MTVREAESLVNSLHSLFDIVRVVDPQTRHVLDLHTADTAVEYPCRCYEIWNRGEVCEHCRCPEVISSHQRRERLELHNGAPYHILCSTVQIDGKTYVLECISRADDAVLTGAVNTARLADEYLHRNSTVYTDALTGVFNYRYYEDNYVTLEQEQAAALLEIDGLTGIRTEYGDKDADLLLKNTAGMIRDHIRSDDVLIRGKHDLFLLLFRAIGRDTFMSRMERIRQDMGSVFLPGRPELHATLSIGGAYRDAENKITPNLLQARLDYAKAAGNSFFCPQLVPVGENINPGLTEKERDIMTFSWDYHSIFAVDFASGHMETVQAAGQNAEWIRNTAKTDYDTYRRAFTEKFILPEDRAWFLRETDKEAVLEHLKNEEVYYINHRILKNNDICYYQTKFARDTHSRNPNRLLVGGHSVDAETRRSLLRLESEERQEKTLRDCIRVLYSQSDMQEAINSLLETVTEYYGAERAYICELDADGRFLKNNYQFYAPGVEHADLNALVKFDELCFDSWVDAFRNDGQLLVEVPEVEAACVPAHRLMMENGIERMIMAPVFSGSDITGFVGLDNPTVNYHDMFLLRSVAAFTYSELLRRNREEMKNNEQLAVIAGLATDYVHVAIVDLKNNLVKVFRMSPELSQEMRGWEDISDYKYKLQMFLDRVIVPEDKERHREFMSREHILNELAKVPAIYHNYTVIMHGQRVALQTKIVRCAQGEECVLVGVKNVERERRRERQIREQLELTVSERTRELQERNRMLNRLNEDVIEFLGGLTEARDKESGEHINRVKGYTNILARRVMQDCPEYGLTEDKVEIITSASALHDLGKIMIPDKVLLKPGRLTDEEFAIMKTHCVRGAEILKHAPRGWSGEYLQTSIDIVTYHHEKVDGRGYPMGLRGDEIPISAQIVSVADCYDALTTKRVYKDAYPHDVAFEMIMNGRCGAFSEKILACLKKCRERFEEYAHGTFSADTGAPVPFYAIENLAGVCILLAEDNDISRSIIQEILEGEGAVVLSAADGAQALEILQQDKQLRIDAVLTDIDMPKLDGASLAATIRAMQNERIRNMPILALTGNADRQTQERCLGVGMDAFLTKPVTISVLTKSLLMCLNRRSQQLRDQMSARISAAEQEKIEGALSIRAFTETVQKLSEQLITGEKKPFALLDADVNDLKSVNRIYGHEIGDLYLQNCCRILHEVFPQSSIYRIGGDEFMVLLIDEMYERREELMHLLRFRKEEAMTKADALEGRVSFAFGLGVFDPICDSSVSAVFERAEQAMLDDKQWSEDL